MTDLIIYVGDQLVDLYPNTPFKITFNNLDLGDLTSRDTNFTNSIKIPKTANNLLLFGVVNINSNSSKPYTKEKVKVIEQGIQIFEGFAWIKSKGESLTVSIGTDDVSKFEELDTRLVSEATNSAFGALDADSYYDMRTGLNSVTAPVLNWGKLTDIPPTLVENSTFSTVLEPWQNTFSGIDWVYSSGTKVAFTLGQSSKLLNNDDFKFYPGYKYKVTLSFSLSANLSTNVKIYANKGTNLIFNQNYTTSGSKTLVSEYSVDGEIEEGIGFVIERPSGAGSQVLTLTSIKIEVDYDSFIQIRDPFYLPVFGYTTALDIALQLFSQNALVTNSTTSLTEEQSNYLLSLAMAYTRDTVRYSNSALELHNVLAKNENQSLSIAFPVTNTSITWTNHLKFNYGFFDSGSTFYSVPNTTTGYYAWVKVDLLIDLDVVGGANAFIRLSVGADNYDSEIFVTDGDKQVTINTELLKAKGNLMDNTLIRVTIRNSAGTGTVNATILTGTLTITQVPYPQDEVVSLSQLILPDITVLDMLKDYAIRTASLVRYNVKDDFFEAQCLENIISSKNLSVDWTSKRDKDEDEDITFEAPGYSQVNYFQDSQSDNNLISRMELNVDNENIAPEQVYYQSIFGTREDETVKTAEVANLKTWDYESEKQYDATLSADGQSREYRFESRETLVMLKLRDNTSDDPEVYYGTNLASDFKVAQYAPWSDFKDLFYGNLEKSLNKAKVIKRGYYLTPIDINDLDMFRLVYDDGSYFLILKVEYSPKNVSSVTLLRINEGYPSPIAVEPSSGSIVFTGYAPTVEPENV